MKGCNKRGDVSGITYNSSTKRVKIRNDIIYTVRGMFFCIIFLSILS